MRLKHLRVVTVCGLSPHGKIGITFSWTGHNGSSVSSDYEGVTWNPETKKGERSLEKAKQTAIDSCVKRRVPEFVAREAAERALAGERLEIVRSFTPDGGHWQHDIVSYYKPPADPLPCDSCEYREDRLCDEYGCAKRGVKVGFGWGLCGR